MIENIRHTAIVTRDLKSALYFYNKLLGMRIITKKRLKGSKINLLLVRVPDNRLDLTYVKLGSKNFPEKDTCLLEIYYFHNEMTIKNADFRHIAFTVDNIDAIYNKLKKENVRVNTEPRIMGNNKIFFCRDFDGNLIELVEELK